MTTYPIALTDGLHLLGNDDSNLHFIRGARATALVEVGISGVVDAVIEQLHGLGAAPDYLVVTHPHADHVTGLAGLQQRFPAATVVAAPAAAGFLAHPRAVEALLADDRFMTTRLAEWGWQPGRPPVSRPPSLAGARTVVDGETIDLGGRTLVFLETGGHSPGNLAVHVPELETVLASDSLGFRYRDGSCTPLFFTGLEPFLATLDRLESLAPAILGIGHHGPFTGGAVAGAFAAARRAARELQGRVLAHRGSDEDLADALFRETYREELTLYSQRNIRGCMGLLIRRVREAC
ncbi:MAG TPA: MBL fold metallo-hydrolase [Deferrisomatales bacterium]|nr:MBL fold metallo-hydrolase [Deferrisomatales bacterium]